MRRWANQWWAMSFYNGSHYANRRRSGTSDLRTATDILCLVIIVLYALKVSFDTTLFQIFWPSWYLSALRLLAYTVILLKVGCTKVYMGEKWALCILSFVAFRQSWLSTEYDFLLDTALLAISAAGMPYKKILKAGFWTELYVLLMAMMGSFADCIADLIYLSKEEAAHSFGIVYTTDFAAHVFYLVLIGWIVYGGHRLFPSAIYMAGLTFLIYYFTKAKCSTIVLLLFLFGTFYYFYMEKKAIKSPKAFVYQRSVETILLLIMPLGALFMICLSLFYDSDNTVMAQLNLWLNNRLSFGNAAADEYGIKLFGTAFQLIGAGGGVQKNWNYNFVDCSYVLILIRYGLIVLLVLLLQNIRLIRDALQNKERKLAFVIVLIAIHSMIEHHLSELAYNLLLLLPFADFTKTNDDRNDASLPNKEQFIYHAAKLIGCAGIIIVFPRVTSCMKTLVNIFSLNDSQNHIWFIGMVTILFLAGYCLFQAFLKVVAAVVHKKALYKRLVYMLAGGLFCICLYTIGEYVITHRQPEYRNWVEADRSIIEMLMAADEPIGRLYIDYIPDIYKGEFDNISSSVLANEGATFLKNTTILVVDKEELPALINAGYEYAAITPEHAIYTNSDVVKRILKKNGIQLSDYYNKVKVIDLQAVLLNKDNKSFCYKPEEIIYKGWLVLGYQIRLISNDMNEDVVASIQISSDNGQVVLNEADILATDFSEDGECFFTFMTGLSYNFQGLEFMLQVNSDTALEIQTLQYGKIQ